jgi:hypothetical protein
MSGFEFVLVLYAIIVGLGISDILKGWGEQIRVRHRMAAYPLQLALSLMLMIYGITYLWAMWTFRDIVWTFNLYAAMAVIPLAISLASRVARVDTSAGAPPARDQYFRNAKPVFILMALAPAMLILLSFLSPVRDSVLNPPNLAWLTALRVVIFAGILYVAWSRNEKVHWVGIVALLMVVMALSTRLTVRAIEGGA